MNNYKKWTEEDIERLKLLSRTHSIPELAKILNRSYDAVFTRLKKLGIKAVNKTNYWSEEEIEFLKANYSSMNKKDLAKKLNRIYGLVLNKGRELGIANKVIDIPEKWSDEDI